MRRTFMKVIALNGSRRKRYTHNLIHDTAEVLYHYGIDVEIINLFDYNIRECIGCEKCILSNQCVLQDDADLLMQKLVECDGIILASPVYMQAISGKFKTFIDRTCRWFHRPELYGKPIIVMATTKGSGLKHTLKYLQLVVTQWGAINAGSIGRNIQTMHKSVSATECKQMIVYLKSPKDTFSPSLKSLIYFQLQKVLSQNMIATDEEYWTKKEWYSQPYYFDCNIHPLKKLISTQFYKLLSNKIHPNK